MMSELLLWLQGPAGIQFIATCVKVVFCAVVSLTVPAVMVWIERRQSALIQRRVGPNRVGVFSFSLWGLGQSVADSIKLLFKEDGVPNGAHRLFFWLAPVITAGIGVSAFSAIPFGRIVEIGGQEIALQTISLNSGFLFLFALSSLSVYGVVLAGWSANNKYTLLGGLRSSAQMISYEIAMGMSLVPLVFIYGTLDLQKIVEIQAGSLLFGFLPNWGIFYAPLSFIIFFITMFAETNRLPFDLAEGESELVAGFHTEHGSMRFALFFLGEYVMMFVLSAFLSTLFLGGYELPYLSHQSLVEFFASQVGSRPLGLGIAALIGFVVLMLKIGFFMLVFVQVRWTLPRFRYDQLMKIGWEVLLPLALINAGVTALITGLIRFTR